MVKITDVAKAAGVSVATVSRVVNGRSRIGRISEETRLKVLKVADRLGYQANPAAVALKASRTGVLGAIVRDISDPLMTELTQEIERQALASGLDILVGHNQFDSATAARQATLMTRSLFDGLILVGSLLHRDVLVDRLRNRVMPAVSVLAGAGGSMPSVEVDDAAGIRLAVGHLYDLGHREFGFIGTPDLPGVSARFETLKDELAARGLIFRPERAVFTPNYRNGAIEATKGLLEANREMTAIVCSSDNLALGALSAIAMKGLKVPTDISVMGFDDIAEATLSYPTLTTIRQPLRQMAEAALQELQRQIGGAAEGDPPRAIFQPDLQIRQSTGVPPLRPSMS